MSRPHAEVIGDPIAHSKSPTIHAFWLRKLGMDAKYHACHVRPDQLAEYFTRRREDVTWRGCNVTIPHKIAAMAHVDHLDTAAVRVGAINTIVEGGGVLTGHNTDVTGVAEAVASISLEGRIAVVLGAGGAARSAFAFLAGQDCTATVLARDVAKARTAAGECGLQADVRPFASGVGGLTEAVLVINATQLGMSGQEAMPAFIPDELAETAPEALVFDMVYAPLETELLRTARRLGRGTADGLAMLIGQAAAAFELFFGRPAPREHDAELRALLTS